jgi:glycosyltransferase involved in cell wall biosynthesis
VGYGYLPVTTGRYLEDSLAKSYNVTYAGTSDKTRPGYSANVDLLDLLEEITPQPDLFLYIDSGSRSYLPRNIEKLPCPTAAYMIDVHLGNKLRRPIAALFDYVFVAQRDLLENYRIGEKQHVSWLPLACDHEIHADQNLPRTFDIGFVGSLGKKSNRRQEYLEILEKRYRLNDFRVAYSRKEISKIYSQSKIVFNCPISGDVNMRVFEAMASGALLITEQTGNGLLEMFQEGKHLVTYKSQADLLEKIAYYLEHDLERQKIAQAGKAEVLAKHTYAYRAKQILRAVFEDAPGAQAPLRKSPEGKLIAHYANIYSMLRLLDPSFDLLKVAFARKQSRLAASRQFLATTLRRIKYG